MKLQSSGATIVNCTISSGLGGPGGSGGPGGGGAGGPSFGIARRGTTVVQSGNTIAAGEPGQGGASPGRPGMPGQASGDQAF